MASFWLYCFFSVLVVSNVVTFSVLFYREWWVESESESESEVRDDPNGGAFWSPTETRTTQPSPPAPAKLPKVAICVAGGLRTFFHPKVRELMKTNLFEALVTSAEDRRIFFDVALSSHCEARPRNPRENEDCKRFNERVVKQESFISILQSDPMLNSSLFRFSDDLSCKHTYLQNEPCCSQRVRTDNAAMGGYLAYQRKRYCYDWALEYEASQRARNETSEFQFDWFIFTRPDLAFFDPVPLVAELERRSPRVYAVAKEGGQPISDFFYIVPRPLAPDFLHAIRSLYDRDCKTLFHFDWPPEFHLHPLWDTLPIPRQLLPLALSIVHEQGSVDCHRLTNEINTHSRPFLVNGKAISAAEYCSNLANQKLFDPNLIPGYR